MGGLALYDKDDQFRGYLRNSHTFNDDEYQLAEEIELSLSRKSQNNIGQHTIEERYVSSLKAIGSTTTSSDRRLVSKEPLQRKPPEFLSQYTCMLEYALARGIVDLRKSEITESISHGDIFAKLSALLSTGWFWVQIIARKQQGLFITEFEVVTLSFTVLSFAAYVLWLDKPQRVRYPIRITWDIKPPRPVVQNSNRQSFLHLDPRLRQKSMEEHGVDFGKRRRSGGERLSLGKRLAGGSKTILSGLPGFLLRNQGFYLVTGNDAFVFMCDEQPLNRFRTGLLERENVGQGWWLALATLTFIVGAVHFISWGSEFPTTFLRVGWRVNAILLLAIPVLTIVGFGVSIYHSRQPRLHVETREEMRRNSDHRLGTFFKTIYQTGGPGDWLHTFVHFALNISGAVGLICYPIARMILIVLSIVIPLKYGLPESAYEDVDWITLIPHIR
ncbi:hypothetical protein V5O48_007126 [Marasmius crinis-equi]|uniref:Uncharacterized protein n=1 Tax=Marasmius crinis-equi TaxID=585013 RepID=A0ABR3FI10_9AGAR